MAWLSRALLVVAAVVVVVAERAGAQTMELPSPLGLQDVIRIAGERRDEIQAARARARAAEARTGIAGALPDPMISPSLDHLPFKLGGADVSVTLEQQVPLSGIRAHRRSSAQADVDRWRAETRRVLLDVGSEAANAYLVLQERRRTAAAVQEQLTLAREVVTAANARYAAGTAPQSDVLRAEVEVAFLAATAGALPGEIRGAEALLNTSLGLDADTAVPALAALTLPETVPPWTAIKAALTSRPELSAARADVARADAELLVMRDMFRPMATIRTGPSYTMTDGRGWMAMVGFTLPIWRTKLRAAVAEAQAMRAMTDADLRAVTRMVEGEAAFAVGQLQASRGRYAILNSDVLPRTRLAIAPAVSGYAAGQLPMVSVIEAVQALWRVQSDLIAAETQLGLAWARLGRALGSYEAIVP